MNEFLRRILFLPPQRSTAAQDLDTLHYLVITVTMIGATVVALFAAYFLIRYRRRPAHEGRPNPGANAHPPLRLEAAMIGLLAVLFISFWVIGFRQYNRMVVAPENALDVYVMGKQWMWKFAYPHGAASVATLYVPAGRPVRLIMTSRDVIHSFFVPDFRIKHDVVPGRYTSIWFEATQPGVYQILCTEYCGAEHSLMRGQVVALAPADYERWLRSGRDVEPRQPAQELAGKLELAGAALPYAVGVGERTMARRGVDAAARHGCLRCHTLDGAQHIGPTWAGLYGRVVPLEEGGEALVDDAFLTASMMDPMAAIHRGFPAVMPSYLGLMTPPDVAAIVELIRSLRDVTPAPGALERGINNFGAGVEVQP